MYDRRYWPDTTGGDGTTVVAGRLETVIIEAACRTADIRRTASRYVLAEKGIVGNALFGVTERDAEPLFLSDRDNLLNDWQLQIDAVNCDVSEESMKHGMDSYA